MLKRAVFYVYVILKAIRAGRCRERRCADHILRSQIFKIFFASGGKGALTPLTKIKRTFLHGYNIGKAPRELYHNAL